MAPEYLKEHHLAARTSPSDPLRAFAAQTSSLHFPTPPLLWRRRATLPETPLSNTIDASNTTADTPPLGSRTSDHAPTSAKSRGGLLKVLGMWFGIAAAVGNTIAAGIVRAPGDIAQWLPNIYLFFGVWLVGGLYALFGASSMAELGASIPRSGGQYNFSRRAIGDYAGFIVGWSDWLSSCGTSAVVAIVVAEYSGALFAALAGHVKSIAVLVVLAFFVLQWRGVKWGSSTQLITAALKTTAFLVVVIACFLFGGHPSATTSVAAATPALKSGWPLAIAVMLALQAVLYTVDGWDGIVYFGEEVKNPGRDVPRAIFGSVFTIMGIYLLINAAVLYVLPMNEIAGNIFSLGVAVQRVFGHYGDPIIRSIMIVSLFSCINANQLFCSRILYRMSSDGLFFRRAATVNAGGTPTFALLLSTLVAILFVLGSFERVIAMLSFFFVANYTLTYASLFLLRKKEPEMPRPYRAWGYPYTTGIALLGSILFLISSIATDRDNAPLALYMLVASYPIYRIMKFVGSRRAVMA
jgi:APA family basic amino acid/polyamine antiporter